MTSALLPLIFVIFFSITLLGFVLVRNGVIFWGKYKQQFTEQASYSLADMFLFLDAAHLWRVNLVALLAVPLLLWLATDNPILVVIAIVVIAIFPKKFYAWLKQRRIDKI
ncbi:MAG: type II secretion protein F, partial [Halothiobacillus sp.]|nr:type II secretion protein F [Halothiobacillus sp.]